MVSRRRFLVGASVVTAAALLGDPTVAGVRRVAVMAESTGLGPEDGHRVIELGAVELLDLSLTGRSFHAFIDPERDICPGAEMVHGLSREFLAGKPKFAQIADAFIGFVSGAELITHRAAFNIGFIDAELTRAAMPSLADSCSGVTETLGMARRRYPGRRNDLDSLCERLEIDRRVVRAPEQASLVAMAYVRMCSADTGCGRERQCV